MLFALHMELVICRKRLLFMRNCFDWFTLWLVFNETVFYLIYENVGACRVHSDQRFFEFVLQNHNIVN